MRKIFSTHAMEFFLFFMYNEYMAKRTSVNTKNKASRSKKTKKRLAIKSAKITAKKTKKK
jgi:hypothetical protein